MGFSSHTSFGGANQKRCKHYAYSIATLQKKKKATKTPNPKPQPKNKNVKKKNQLENNDERTYTLNLHDVIFEVAQMLNLKECIFS